MLGQKKGSRDVNGEKDVPFCQGDLLERFYEGDTGIIDQGVERLWTVVPSDGASCETPARAETSASPEASTTAVASTHRSDPTAQQGQRGPPRVTQVARDLQTLLFELRSARWVAVVKHECEMDQRIGAEMLVGQAARKG